MKDFFKKYTIWIVAIALATSFIFMTGTWYATNPDYEFFNKKQVVCFKTPNNICYQIISLEIKNIK